MIHVPCLTRASSSLLVTIHKTQRVGACIIVGGDDLRARLRIIFINVVRCDARTGLNQTCNTWIYATSLRYPVSEQHGTRVRKSR